MVSLGQVLVPVWSVATALQTDAVWDKETELLVVNNRSARGKIQGDILYLVMEDIQRIFGGMWLWQQEENCWNLVTPQVGKQ